MNNVKNINRKAVVLLSGGLDSATCLAIGKQQNFDCYALSVDYHQRHIAELQAANSVAKELGVIAHKTVNIDLGLFGGSALTDSNIAVPTHETIGIPVTYVPARNTIMLSLALAWAEVLGAQDIFIGVNAVDFSGYPDCRQEYVAAFQAMANLATKSAVEGQKITVHAPLINMTKAEIINQGTQLALNYAMTVSCYQADDHGFACGLCDSCRLRREGFAKAGITDPTRYQSANK